MSFDSNSASTLDVIDVSGGDPFGGSQWRPQRPKRARSTASTIDLELVQEARGQVSSSSIELIAAPLAYTVASDFDEFRAWRERTGLGTVLAEVARQFSRQLSAVGLKAMLESESEEPAAQRVFLVAAVPAERSDEALEELFAFTSSAWWLTLVRATRNAIVVDILPA